MAAKHFENLARQVSNFHSYFYFIYFYFIYFYFFFFGAITITI